MSQKRNKNELNNVPVTGESDSTLANCLICGRSLTEDANVLPLLCLEAGQAYGFNCVVCEDCVKTFDERIYSFTPVGVVGMQCMSEDILQ